MKSTSCYVFYTDSTFGSSVATCGTKQAQMTHIFQNYLLCAGPFSLLVRTSLPP